MSKIMVNDEAGFSFYNIGRGESICRLRGDLLAKPFHYTKTVRETLIQSQGSVSYGFLSIASSSSSCIARRPKWRKLFRSQASGQWKNSEKWETCCLKFRRMTVFHARLSEQQARL